MRRLDSLTWRRLVFSSLGIAVFAVASISIMAPQPAVSQTVCCLGCSGNLCVQDCKRECSNGSCCSWEFYYKKIDADEPPEEPELPELQ